LVKSRNFDYPNAAPPERAAQYGIYRKFHLRPALPFPACCESKCGIARHMKEKLLKQSADAAQRAIRHYLKNEFDQFFIQAGIS
jgi:hypothetical protein